MVGGPKRRPDQLGRREAGGLAVVAVRRRRRGCGSRRAGGASTWSERGPGAPELLLEDGLEVRGRVAQGMAAVPRAGRWRWATLLRSPTQSRTFSRRPRCLGRRLLCDATPRISTLSSMARNCSLEHPQAATLLQVRSGLDKPRLSGRPRSGFCFRRTTGCYQTVDTIERGLSMYASTRIYISNAKT